MPTNSTEKTPWSDRDYKKFAYFALESESRLSTKELAVIVDKDEKTCAEFIKLIDEILKWMRGEGFSAAIAKQLKSNKYNNLISVLVNDFDMPDPMVIVELEEKKAAEKAQSSKTDTGPKTGTENKTVTIDADQMARFMYVLGKMEEKLEEIEKAINANADVRTQQIQDLKSSIQCALKKK